MKNTTIEFDPKMHKVIELNGNTSICWRCSYPMQLISTQFLAFLPIPNDNNCTAPTLTYLTGSNIFSAKNEGTRLPHNIFGWLDCLFLFQFQFPLTHHFETVIADTVLVWPHRNSCLLLSIFKMEIFRPSGKIKWLLSNFNPPDFEPTVWKQILVSNRSW